MHRYIEFMGFVPTRWPIRQTKMPLKISFCHTQSGFGVSQTIVEHEKWVGYRLVTDRVSVYLDPDADVSLEARSEDGYTVKKVITKDEMKCLMHYIVFFMKDYEISSSEVVRTTNIRIVQNDRTHATMHVKDIRKFRTVHIDIFGGSGENGEPVKLVTAFETIGKDGVIYGVYEMNILGIFLEIPKAPPSEDRDIKIEPAYVDLMKGMSEKEDVAICPTVHIAGNFETSPFKMSMNHCAELSPAALEGRGKITLYAKPEPSLLGEGKVSRREMDGSEYEIEKEKVSFYVNGPGFYTVSMKDEFVTGKRVALVAFLPQEMPKNRRPVLHVNFYYPFGELGQRISAEWKKKDNICVADETTFLLHHIGKDADVTCQMATHKYRHATLKSTLETEALDIVPHECLDFDLDYTSEKTNEVNVKVRVLQEECIAELDIKESLKVPAELEIPPPPEPPKPPEEPTPPEEPKEPERTPRKVTDQMIEDFSRRKISTEQLSVLVNALGYDKKDFEIWKLDNMGSPGGKKGYNGTRRLLTRWRDATNPSQQRPQLREALRRATLSSLAKMHLKREDDYYED